MAGEKTIEFLHKNLKFPSPATVKHWFHHDYERLQEGKLRIVELCDFLSQNNYPKVVWMAEDSTSLKPQVEYDPITDEIIGFVRPLHTDTGLPICNMFAAISPSVVKSYIDKYPTAEYINAILVQPLNPFAPYFILSLYCTDNKFCADDVQKRNNYIRQQLEMNGIKLLGFSTDAASAYLKCQKNMLKYGASLPISLLPSPEWEEFWAFDLNFDNLIAIQDSFHEVSKLRNRLHKASCPPKIGQYVVSITDLVVSFSQNFNILSKRSCLAL